MSAQAIDYPADDRLTVFGPSTDYGDDLLQACGSPAGWTPEVVSHPRCGTVVFTGVSGWRITVTDATPGEDEFTYRLRSGNDVSNVAKVLLFVAEQ